ncbi:Tbingi protein [Trypanosoma cruzi]|nr:Tbingi protein [Trypanosoma cruzi]
MGSPALGFCRPACGFWRCGNDGLTRHRTACHGRRPDVVKTGQRELCEERSPHLLRCPARQAPGQKRGVDNREVRNLCFTKEFSRFPLDAERRQARCGCCVTPMLVAGVYFPLFLVLRWCC